MANSNKSAQKSWLMRLGPDGLSVVFAITGLIAAAASYLEWKSAINVIPAFPVRERLEAIASEQERLGRATIELRSQIEALGKSPSTGIPSLQLDALDSSVKNLERRFSRIEKAILQDPAKALEVPMLRKDLEKVQELTIAQVGSLRQDIERTYSLITGTMIALALAVLAPALSSLFKRERAESKEGREAPNSVGRADV